MTDTHIIEAVCKKCNNTFNPHSTDPQDLVHLWDESGERECGGEGEIIGEWVFPENGKPSHCEVCGAQPGEVHTEDECFK